ncbi:MAG TPA: S-layer homology domain-containing protein [Egibacteraceae bacterium]|nr:S-layer homology domain-containing protein [Egibacteraceae bacterium]
MPVRWLAVVVCAALVAAGSPGEGRATAAADPQPTGSARLDRSGDDYYLPVYESVHDQAGFYFSDGGLPLDLAVWHARVSSDTDPTGILVPAVREGRNSSVYFGSFGFTRGPSDPMGQRLSVADGDQVTLTYRDVSGGQHTSTVPWRDRSKRPDIREIVHLRPAASQAVLEGAAGAVSPNATVLLYATEETSTPLATATADGDGRFVVEATLSEPPHWLWVASRSPGLPESVRKWEERAWIAGRVVVPEPGLPLPASTWVDAIHETETHLCGERLDCRSGHMTNQDGRWAAVHDLGPAGGYRVMAHPWSAEYGNSSVRTVQGDGSVTTIDAGTSVLAAPNFHGRAVTSTGLPVPEVAVDSTGSDGMSAMGAQSGRDGRFRMHFGLQDRRDWGNGDFAFRVWTPIGCGYEPVPDFRVSATNGRPSPATIELVLRPGAGSEITERVPLAPFAAGRTAVATVDLGSGPVQLSLDGINPDGMLSLSLACAAPAVLDGVSLLDPPVNLSLNGSSFTRAEVCLPYTDERRADLGVDAEDLELVHIRRGQVEAVTTTVDAANHVVCGETTSFSAFAVAAVTTAPTPGAWCPAGQVPGAGFSDVLATNVHKPAIDCAVWRGIAAGTSTTTYAPAAQVSRAQMASFLARLLKAAGAQLPASPADHFDDDNGSVHEAAINQLAELAITKGTGAPRTYTPGGQVNRAQMASFLMRTHEHTLGSPAPLAPDRFTDDNGNIHEPRINQAAAAGFTQGVGDNLYGPSLPTRRDQMASFLVRVLNAIPRPE